MRIFTVLFPLLVALAACSRSATPADTAPTDGKALFGFLNERIPELAAKVPCSCCEHTLGECYRGACPPECGPCNQIGRDVYTWHKQGLSDDTIIARVRAKYPRP